MKDETCNQFKVWLTTKNGEFVVVASDPPGKTGESTPPATHAITISFANAVAVGGKFEVAQPDGDRDENTIKVKLKKDAEGNLKVLGSDPPGKTGKSSATTHALIIPLQPSQEESVPMEVKFKVDRF